MGVVKGGVTRRSVSTDLTIDLPQLINLGSRGTEEEMPGAGMKWSRILSRTE